MIHLTDAPKMSIVRDMNTILSNPNKTVIWKVEDGWIDRDEPNRFHPTRSEARQARRTRLGLAPLSTSGSRPYSALETRAANRMRSLGVPEADIDEVVRTHGYNAAVSYGHMRKAGATDAEALEVIDLADPEVSLAYGLARAQGMSHDGALDQAL